MDKKIELRKVRDFGEVINDTFVFIAQNWKALLKTYVIICGFFVIASMVISGLNQVKMASLINEGSSAPFRMGGGSGPFRIFTLEYFLSLLFVFISYMSVSLTTMSFIAVYREKGNETPTVEEVWSYFKFYFLRVSISWLLLGIGLCIGFVLCLIPGFYLWPAFSLVIPVMVFENTTLGYAFSRGFALVKDNYWPTLGVLVISVIIVYVGMAVFVLPISAFNTASVLTHGHTMNTTYLILTNVATHICQVFYMMPEIAICLVYFSLTEQRDNVGLLDRINNLGNPDQGLDPLPTEEY